MATFTLDGENSLKKDLEAIQSFTDEQVNFYRYNEPNYYHDILKIINFIKELKSKTLYLDFIDNKKIIKDFKELFQLFIDDKEYNSSSAAKQNFHTTIKKLIEIINSYNKHQKKEITNVEKVLQFYEEKFNTMEESLKNYQVTSNLLHKDLKDKNTQIDIIAKKAQNIETAFSEKINLHEAKEYWNKKSIKHTINALATFIIFLTIIFSISFITYDRIATSKSSDIKSAPTTILDKNITSVSNTSQVNSYEDRIKRHEIIRYIQYLFLLSLFIWISRILLKITFSNLHLREEAHEKETMIMTYLALINEGGGLETNDRQLILEAIFRPSTNGLIKDESNLTILDVIKSIKN